MEYRLALQEDLEQVCRIINASIISDPSFTAPIRALYPSLGDGFEAVIAEDNGIGVGVVVAQRGLAYSNQKTDLFDQIHSDYPGKQLWTINDIAVLESHRHLHVGSQLFHRMSERLKEKGIEHALMEIWVRANGYQPARNLLHLAPGYRDYGYLDDFYTDQESIYSCDFCKPGVCHCKAHVCIIDL